MGRGIAWRGGGHGGDRGHGTNGGGRHDRGWAYNRGRSNWGRHHWRGHHVGRFSRLGLARLRGRLCRLVGLVGLVGLGVSLGGLGLGLVLASRLCGLVVRLVRRLVVRFFMDWLAFGGRGRRLLARRVTMIVMDIPTLSWGRAGGTRGAWTSTGTLVFLTTFYETIADGKVVNLFDLGCY